MIDEDELLEKCNHRWVDFYNGAGISKRNDKLLNVWMFCKKCLERRQVKIDISDNDYDEDYDE